MTYLRLLAPDLLPSDATHAVYLDSDLLVRASLEELWKLLSSRSAIAGVPDFGAPVASSLRACRTGGSLRDAPYLNSGVLLMNLSAWRSGDVGHRVVEYCVHHKEFDQYPDQDGINALALARPKR